MKKKSALNILIPFLYILSMLLATLLGFSWIIDIRFIFIHLIVVLALISLACFLSFRFKTDISKKDKKMAIYGFVATVILISITIVFFIICAIFIFRNL